MEDENITTLGEFLGLWRSLDPQGLSRIAQHRKKDRPRTGGLLLRIDIKRLGSSLSKWLPIQPGIFGLSFHRALLATILGLTPIKRSLLELRLVQKLTLEDCSVKFQLTRERARQVEAKFLAALDNVLNNFRKEKEEMMLLWLEEKDWMHIAGTFEHSSDQHLVTGGLEAIFEDTPYGVARALSEEHQKESWEQSILSDPEFYTFGICLSEFMERNVPERDRSDFCELLTNWSWLHLDHASGKAFVTSRSSLT